MSDFIAGALILVAFLTVIELAFKASERSKRNWDKMAQLDGVPEELNQ